MAFSDDQQRGAVLGLAETYAQLSRPDLPDTLQEHYREYVNDVTTLLTENQRSGDA
jgi:hypothetical protein